MKDGNGSQASTNEGMYNAQKVGESKEEVEEWKTRAPYSIHEDNRTFKALYEAQCHCGRVKYELSRDAPLSSKLCHCTTCQTQHGELRHFYPRRINHT
jgi:hypothetical protein